MELTDLLCDTYARDFADSGLDIFPEYECDIDQLFTEAFDCTMLPEARLTESENSHQVAAAHVPLVQSNQPHPPTTTSVRAHFAAPVNEPEIQRRRIDAVPQKTSTDTKYCVNVWEEWRKFHHSSFIFGLNYNTTAVLDDPFCFGGSEKGWN